MKRINAITRGKGILASVLDRRAKRLDRQVCQAIDAAKDKADELREKAEELINKMGKKTDAEQTHDLQDLLNSYVNTLNEAELYDKAVEHLTELKEKLQEDVEVINED